VRYCYPYTRCYTSEILLSLH